MNEQNENVVDKIITPEVQEKLDRLRGYTPKSTFFWTPPLYKENMPKDAWPVFKLQTRTASEHAMAEDRFTVIDDRGYMKTNTAELRIHVLRHQIKGWNKNHKDRNGDPIPFEMEKDKDGKETELVSTECMERVSKEMQIVIMEAVNDEEKLSEEELAGLEF